MACKRSSVRIRYPPQKTKRFGRNTKPFCFFLYFYTLKLETIAKYKLMKKHIPNFLTLLNLFCGCCAIVSILEGQYTEGAIFIGVSLIADFFDGYAARYFKVSSPLGLQLDSLADMVSFGVVPGIIIYSLLSVSFVSGNNIGSNSEEIPYLLSLNIKAIPAFIVTMFSCLRLAKFNLDTRQTQSFIGLNTPSNTTFYIGLMLIAEYNSFGLAHFVSNPVFLYSLIPISSYLLIAEIPMFSMKGGLDKMKIAYIVLSTLLLIFFREVALSLNMIIYVLFNISNYFYHKKLITA